jgi:hypothetical protein
MLLSSQTVLTAHHIEERLARSDDLLLREQWQLFSRMSQINVPTSVSKIMETLTQSSSDLYFSCRHGVDLFKHYFQSVCLNKKAGSAHGVPQTEMLQVRIPVISVSI